jgi:hypothetical protein
MPRLPGLVRGKKVENVEFPSRETLDLNGKQRLRLLKGIGGLSIS